MRTVRVRGYSDDRVVVAGETLRAGEPVEVCISSRGCVVLVVDGVERQEVARIVFRYGEDGPGECAWIVDRAAGVRAFCGTIERVDYSDLLTMELPEDARLRLVEGSHRARPAVDGARGRSELFDTDADGADS